MKPILISDPNFLKFLQTNKFKAGLCNENGKRNDIGPFLNPESEAVLNKTEISVRTVDHRSSIKSIQGIEAFRNLKELSCQRLGLTLLPELPDGIENLNLSINKIEKIDRLPNSLKHLNVSFNPKIKISKLPEGLLSFNCNDCGLKTLPELPKSLTELNCRDNKLTELPDLGDHVKVDSEGNKIRKTVGIVESFFVGGPKDNFNLKLHVMNALLEKDAKMQENMKKILNESKISDDLKIVGYIVMIESFIKNYKISSKELDSIKALKISAKNRIFELLCPDMELDGTDYLITSFDGIDELKKLKKISIESCLDSETDLNLLSKYEVTFN